MNGLTTARINIVFMLYSKQFLAVSLRGGMNYQCNFIVNEFVMSLLKKKLMMRVGFVRKDMQIIF